MKTIAAWPRVIAKNSGLGARDDGALRMGDARGAPPGRANTLAIGQANI